MCFGCYEKAGSPTIDNEKVRALIPLIESVYEFSCVGGGLHVVLDDENLGDEFMSRYEQPDDAGEPERVTAEEACLAALKDMTHAERVSAVGLWMGYWQSGRTPGV